MVGSMRDGLTTLRNLMFQRIHDDVEHIVGTDSMLYPLSAVKSEQKTKEELDVYQIAVSAAHVEHNGYVGADGPWYARWLAQWCLGENAQESRLGRRLLTYQSMDPDQRRLAFSDVLANVFPESLLRPVDRVPPVSVGGWYHHGHCLR